MWEHDGRECMSEGEKKRGRMRMNACILVTCHMTCSYMMTVWSRPIVAFIIYHSRMTQSVVLILILIFTCGSFQSVTGGSHLKSSDQIWYVMFISCNGVICEWVLVWVWVIKSIVSISCHVIVLHIKLQGTGKGRRTNRGVSDRNNFIPNDEIGSRDRSRPD